jgi:aspartyl-tRNA(Asn)/glutamyl-tRNA(Gln) amidotransferase subunit C
MKIEDLQETAQLAHLNMSEQELAAAFPAFEQIVGYFAAMQAADEDSAAFGPSRDAAAGNTRAVSSSHFRTDTQAAPLSTSNTLINNACDQDGTFLVIPNVL